MHHKRLWVLIMAVLWIFAPDLLETSAMNSLLEMITTFGFWALLIGLAFFTYYIDSHHSS